MKKNVKITIIGGGSHNWCPTIIRDILKIEGLNSWDFRLLDIDPPAARRIARLGRKMAADWNLSADFSATDAQDVALKGADFVTITISTGGFETMARDLKIPEKFGIYQTVGDTVGPGGWSRALRNIPVFVDLTQKIRRFAPQAFIINYTNPLSTLTRTICLHTDQPAVGLCHGLFEVYDLLMQIFGLKDEKQVRLRIAGLNHFFWLLDLKIKGRDGYKMLQQRLKGKSLSGLYKSPEHPSVFHSRRKVAAELFERYGYLPYIGDRHTCEFFSNYIVPNIRKLREYALIRTSIDYRKRLHAGRLKQVMDQISGREEISPERSRETAADIIAAVALGREFVDVVNLPNQGQIPNLPHGTVVETLGVVNSLGFTPLVAGLLPEGILPLVMPHALNQKLIVEAGVTGDWDKAFIALANEPACANLNWPQIEKMGTALLRANKKYLPQFFKAGKRR